MCNLDSAHGLVEKNHRENGTEKMLAYIPNITHMVCVSDYLKYLENPMQIGIFVLRIAAMLFEN